MLDKTPLEMALEREGQIEYCDECEYVRVCLLYTSPSPRDRG